MSPLDENELPPVTYELQLRCLENDAAAAAVTKAALLELLVSRGISNFADGIIDGVETLIADGDVARGADFSSDPAAAPAQWTGELPDATPIYIWDFSAAVLQQLAAEINAAYQERVSTRLIHMPTAAWQTAWEDDGSILLTRRFCVCPAGKTPPEAPGVSLITLVAGSAFGDGRHATTKAALIALEDYAAAGPNGACLDVGTGTGVLAVAAGILGYKPIIATEIDAEVIAEAQANAVANRQDVAFELSQEPPLGTQKFALIMANILVPVLHQLMPVLATRLNTDGAMILAGYIAKEAEPLVALAQKCGLNCVAEHTVRGWVALTFKPHRTWPAHSAGASI